MLTKYAQHGFSHTLGCTAVLALVVLASSPAWAVPIEFANVNLLNANQPISFTNNGGVSGTIKGVNIPVTFTFTSQSGLSTADHLATLSLNAANVVTATPAVALGGGVIDQPIVSPTTLAIIENGTGKNLLTMAFTGDLIGQLSGPNASLSGAQVNGNTVNYTSDFGLFGATDKSFILGLATISPELLVGAGGFLANFIANINGQFSANFTPVPEPASVLMFAVGLVGLFAWARKSRRLKA